jgi:hypothetical protein
MSRYKLLQKRGPDAFKRATGVKPHTFKLMLRILEAAHKKKMHLGGRPCKLSLEDQLFMCLKYLRDYPTHLQLSLEYGVSESLSSRVCRWVEDVLIRSKEFSLPGKGTLLTGKYDVVLVDVGETPIERPKKK